MKTSMISIVVPTYNAEGTLEVCLNSIINQSYENIEILLINDGSTDKTEMVCKKFQEMDARIKYVYQSNQGVSAARNVGIELASGEYIIFIDCDDYISKDYCRELIIAQEEKGCGCLCVSWIENVKQGHCDCEETKANICYNICELLKLMDLSLLNSPVNKLYKKQYLLEKNIRMPVEFNIAEDLEFNITYLRNANFDSIYILRNTKYYYNISTKHSLSKKYQPYYYEIHKHVFKELKDLCDDIHIQESDWKIYYKWYWNALEKSLVNTMMPDNKETFIKKILYNNEIVRQDDFAECLEEQKDILGKNTYRVYKLKNYILLKVYLRLGMIIK